MQALLIGAMFAILASIGSFFYGMGVGEDRLIAKQAADALKIAEVRAEKETGAANEIAKTEPKNTIIRQRVETIVRENIVYRDCVHEPASLSAINEAITGKPSESSSDSKLPRAESSF